MQYKIFTLFPFVIGGRRSIWRQNTYLTFSGWQWRGSRKECGQKFLTKNDLLMVRKVNLLVRTGLNCWRTTSWRYNPNINLAHISQNMYVKNTFDFFNDEGSEVGVAIFNYTLTNLRPNFFDPSSKRTRLFALNG